MTGLAELVAALSPPFAMTGIAWARDGAAPAFHIATAPGVACGPDTLWRAATLSKVVTGRVAELAARAAGLDPTLAEVGPILGFDLRHPSWPEMPVTLAQVASHTAGLSDTARYLVPPEVSLAEWTLGRDIWGRAGPMPPLTIATLVK